MNKDASLYFFRWFCFISSKQVQSMHIKVVTSHWSSRHQFGLIWEFSWRKRVEDLETKDGILNILLLMRLLLNKYSWIKKTTCLNFQRTEIIIGSRKGQSRRLKRRRETQYVGYNHSNSDALTIDECLPQAHCFNSRLQPWKEFRFRHKWATPDGGHRGR